MSDPDGIPWLTDPPARLPRHLTTLTIQRQLKPERSYEHVSEALGDIADQGLVDLRADKENVWVLISWTPTPTPSPGSPGCPRR